MLGLGVDVCISTLDTVCLPEVGLTLITVGLEGLLCKLAVSEVSVLILMASLFPASENISSTEH